MNLKAQPHLDDEHNCRELGVFGRLCLGGRGRVELSTYVYALAAIGKQISPEVTFLLAEHMGLEQNTLQTEAYP